jgi:histidinol dehydrogenase
MSRTAVIPFFNALTPAARKALQKLSGRLSVLERLDSAAFRARAKAVFGKPLRPDQVVDTIIQRVREKGDAALLELTRKIDGAELTARTMRVTTQELNAAYRATDPRVRKALELASRRIADYQRRLMPADVSSKPAKGGPAGVKTGLLWSPLRRAGLYVPAGTAPLFSSVPMLAVPAQVAGVKDLAVASPCGKDGRINDGILCACEILGVKEIYKLGGAQAIAAFAYGTKSIRATDKIAGPGNLFVMLAKRAVFGHVDVDGLFGPSEVLVIADGSARADYVAADLLAQAEHDPLASCVLLTDSAKLAAAVQGELAKQLATLPRRDFAAPALRDWGLILVTRNLDEAVTIANDLAPEHLEILTRTPRKWVKKLTTAGALFVGPHATEPLGDYIAGPSHTLPTGGTARAFSGVSVYTFLRRTSVIEADAAGLRALAPAIEALAEAEQLEAHRRAVALRGFETGGVKKSGAKKKS